MPFVPQGVLASGSGGMMKAINSVFLPSISKTWSALIRTLPANAAVGSIISTIASNDLRICLQYPL